jgi:hypothetical protein
MSNSHAISNPRAIAITPIANLERAPPEMVPVASRTVLPPDIPISIKILTQIPGRTEATEERARRAFQATISVLARLDRHPRAAPHAIRSLTAP